jgi:hypothetical protein
MKPLVVIHIDSLRREYASSWFLGQKFKLAGYSVVLTSRASTSYLLRILKPEIVILSHVFTLSADMLTKLCRGKVKVYINEVEGVLLDEAGIASTYPTGYIDYSILSGIFVWSQWSRDWLIQNRHLDPAQVHATGSIRNSIIVKRGLINTAPVVGFLSRFEVINTFDDRHKFENLLALDPEDKGLLWYYERCGIDSEAFSIVSKMIGILTRKGIAVSIRPHPNENVSSYSLLKERFGPLLSIDSSCDLTEWLGKVSVIAGPVSTAYTEAYLANIPIVSTQGIQKIHYTDVDRIKIISKFARAAYLPSTVDDAVSLCENPLLAPINSSDLNDYFDSFYSIKKESDPIDEIVAFVDSDAKAALLTQHFMLRWFGRTLKYFIDLASLTRMIFSRHPLKSFRLMKQYDFNSFLHHPNAHMKNIEIEKLPLSH